MLLSDSKISYSCNTLGCLIFRRRLISSCKPRTLLTLSLNMVLFIVFKANFLLFALLVTSYTRAKFPFPIMFPTSYWHRRFWSTPKYFSSSNHFLISPCFYEGSLPRNPGLGAVRTMHLSKNLTMMLYSKFSPTPFPTAPNLPPKTTV